MLLDDLMGCALVLSVSSPGAVGNVFLCKSLERLENVWAQLTEHYPALEAAGYTAENFPAALRAAAAKRPPGHYGLEMAL